MDKLLSGEKKAFILLALYLGFVNNVMFLFEICKVPQLLKLRRSQL